MLHGLWVLLAALLLVPVLELIPLAALAALVMVVGVQMVSLTHMRSVQRHREILVYAVTTGGGRARGRPRRCGHRASRWPSPSPCTG